MVDIYCLEDFKDKFEKLSSNKKYKDLESEIIDYFFEKEIADVISGTRLNHSDTEPYIKKRIAGSGGYRVYFLLLIKKEKLYLMFVHPKTGPEGSDNITDESKAYLYKKILKYIKEEQLYKLSIENGRILFDPV